MGDSRSFATNAVGAAIAIVGISFLLGAAALFFSGSFGGILAGLLVGFIGLLVLVGAWLFLLVPTKVDELEADHTVRVRDEE